jgi:dTDP-4-amino-4,6-dideoxygalactose transaminase
MNIPVTKPFLPPYEDYERYLKGIWQRGWLTNHGPLVNELELRLKDRLGLDHLLFLTNGTIALQIAIRALELQGEIITTPFSYVATTASIVWEHARPVMVDICPRTLNLDPAKVEAAITPRTSAILATHVFGNPCDIEALEVIARRHGLKIIYDAAHGFGSRYCGESLLSFGDIATCSFHATKLFHTGEGGAVCTANPELLRKLALLRNFGHASQTEFDGIGINGKNSEFHAAMGLANLPHLDLILASRKQLSLYYHEGLKNSPVMFQEIRDGTDYNHAYFPVIFKDECTVERIQRVLNQNSIFPRRYFYPSLSTLPYVGQQTTPIAEDISPRILCLPMFHGLSAEEVAMICRLIKRTIRYPG